MANLYERIKAICSQQGRSVRSVEVGAKLSNGTISGWATSSPRVDSLQAAAEELGVPIQALLEEEAV